MKRTTRKSVAIQIFAVFAALCILPLCVFSQRDEYYRRQAEQERLRQQQERDLQDRRRNLENLRPANSPRRPNQNNAEGVIKPPVIKEDQELRAKTIAVDISDLQLYTDFLKQPKTGIFRLFPDLNCDETRVVRADGKCDKIFSGTWTYSFRTNDYSNENFFDIWLKDGKFITEGYMSQGILVKLGNFSLDKVSLQSVGAKFLVDFKPAEKIDGIKAQFEQINQGISADGFIYSRVADVKLGQVYLLRVVAYRLQQKFSENKYTLANPRLFALSKDERADIIVAFRVIRQEINGNLTIVWKELNRKQSPEVLFTKN